MIESWSYDLSVKTFFFWIQNKSKVNCNSLITVPSTTPCRHFPTLIRTQHVLLFSVVFPGNGSSVNPDNYWEPFEHPSAGLFPVNIQILSICYKRTYQYICIHNPLLIIKWKLWINIGYIDVLLFIISTLKEHWF